MSEKVTDGTDPKGDEKEVIDGDAEVKKIIEERVIKHIVEVRNQPAAPASKPTEGKETVSKPNEETPEELLKRLQEAEAAREEAERLLEEEKTKAGITADELEQRKAQLDALALKEFEEKKTILVGKVRESQGDEKADEVEEMIKTGADVDRVTRWLEIFSDALSKDIEGAGTGGEPPENGGEPKKVPTGKVSGRAPVDPDADTRASGTEWVMEVYDNIEELHFLRRMGMPFDARKLEDYEGKRNQLLRSFLKGEKTRQSITRMTVMECRECNKILTQGETVCPECGANIYHKTGGGP